MEQNALRSKLKLQEEELKYQKILEIELKADNELNSQNMKSIFRIRAAV
jgi:hypothetical protein